MASASVHWYDPFHIFFFFLNNELKPHVSSKNLSVPQLRPLRFPKRSRLEPLNREQGRRGWTEQLLCYCSTIINVCWNPPSPSSKKKTNKKNILLLRATQSKWRSVTFPQHLHIQAECVVKRTQTSVRQRDRIQRLYWRSLMCALLCVMCTCQGTQTCITRRGESGIPLTLYCLK